jgi:uncharacterized protein (DUF1501 family)
MTLSRRLFLKNGGLALASVGLVPTLGPAFLRRAAFAADSTAAKRRKTLVCIFLRGAADGLSIVVPHGDPDLYRLRSRLAVPRPAAGRDDTALDLDGFYGLHPALAPLLPLYKAGQLAAVHACGSPSATRSHFDAMDYMESGSPGNKGVRDGWLARAARLCPEEKSRSPFRTLALGGALPRALQGDSGALAIPDLRTFGIQDIPAGRRGRGSNAMMAPALGGSSAADGFETLYDQAVDDVLHGPGQESFEALRMLKSIDPTRYTPAPGARYPNGKFGDSLRQIAQLVKADVGVEIAFADIGGWDTHANQALSGRPTQGQLAGKLRELGSGLAALAIDLGDRLDDTVILTMSEFGRTARQNGTGGTDHGHATCFFALGGSVKGGKVYGDWPGLAPDRLNDGRDLALTTDFRAVFGEVALRHLGVRDLGALFPGYDGTEKAFRGVVRPS